LPENEAEQDHGGKGHNKEENIGNKETGLLVIDKGKDKICRFPVKAACHDKADNKGGNGGKLSDKAYPDSPG